VPVEVHHVIKVAGGRAFSERAQFFSEGFLIGVAIGPDAALGPVAIRMKYLAAHEGKNYSLVCRQVELDLGPAA
jgi:hypothetical protein